MHRELVLDTLERLGIGRRFSGHHVAVEAICMVAEDDTLLLCMKRNILQPLSEKYHCTTNSLERNLRTAVQHAWQINPAYLCQLAGYQMTSAPSVKEFIDIVSTCIIRNRICAPVNRFSR